MHDIYAWVRLFTVVKIEGKWGHFYTIIYTSKESVELLHTSLAREMSLHVT